MIIVLEKLADAGAVEKATRSLEQLSVNFHVVETAQATLLVVLDDVDRLPSHLFTSIPGVRKAVRLSSQTRLTRTEAAATVKLPGGVVFGSGQPVVIAGPCSVESNQQILSAAQAVKRAGAHVLRGGAFKPRTSPYDFQGLGTDGLKYLSEASKATGLPVVSEVMSLEHIEAALDHIDMFQIGARNMYNYELLKEVGKTARPILLKRAMSATLAEFMSAAEYIMLEGNMQVVLCERGIRTFETHMRNTLDLASVPALKQMIRLPIVVDPSHGTGRRDLIRPMARAAVACGADGLMIEVHEDPSRSWSDSEQAIDPQLLSLIVADAKRLHDTLTDADKDAAMPLSVAPPLAVLT